MYKKLQQIQNFLKKVYYKVLVNISYYGRAKTIRDVLTNEEIKKYEENWKNFKGKYKLNSARNVYSGMPVISEVYQFENYPIFRVHVFSKRLRKFDPYFQTAEKSRGYIIPFWHVQHYFMVLEQLYHASKRLILGDEHDKVITKDIPNKLNGESQCTGTTTFQ